jgi:Rha family phage regulatory protein
MRQTHSLVPVVSVVNNQSTTTSPNIAEVFGKQHKNVLESIRALDIPQDFSQRNFPPTSYRDSQGKDQPMFNLTRDGFTILVMGFTGKKAMQFKLAYIEAFNLMEAQLRQQRFPELPPPTLTPDQQRRIQKIIGDKVYATGSKAMYPAYFKHIYRGIKDKFHVAKYDQIPAHLFDDAVAYINSATLTKESDTVTREEIENLKKMFVSYMEANVKPVSEAIISLSSRSVLLSRQLNDLKKDYLRAHGGSSFSERISNISGEAIRMSEEFIHVATESRLNQLELQTALLCA